MKIARFRVEGKEEYGIVEGNKVNIIQNQVRNDMGIERFLLEDDFLEKTMRIYPGI